MRRSSLVLLGNRASDARERVIEGNKRVVVRSRDAARLKKVKEEDGKDEEEGEKEKGVQEER